jgi:hypothetical protein
MRKEYTKRSSAPNLMRADAVIYPGFSRSLPSAAYLRSAQEKGTKL